jgi:hypothetical protein
LAGSGNSALEFQGFRWIGDGKGSFGGAKLATGWGGVSAYYFQLGVEGFEVRDHPGAATETFTLRQSVISTGAAVHLPANITAGATVKAYFEDIYGDRIEGIGLCDVGMFWKERNWAAGAAAANIPFLKIGDDPLPTTIRAGVNYNHRWGDWGLSTAVESSYIADYDPTVHVGIEGDWNQNFYLRGGLMSGHGSYFWSAGVGVAWNHLNADVSLTPTTGELGQILRVGLGVKL